MIKREITYDEKNKRVVIFTFDNNGTLKETIEAYVPTLACIWFDFVTFLSSYKGPK